MIFDEKVVLIIQVAACLMMAAEYFFSKATRKSIDAYLVDYFGDIDSNVSKDWRRFLVYFRSERRRIFLSTSFVVCLVSFYNPLFSYIDRAGVFAVIGLLAILTFGFVKSMSVVCSVVASAAVLFGFGGLLRAISTFLLRTEKGPLAGAGFLLLLISFSMQYANINAL